MMADRTLTINYPSESNAPDKLSDLPASSSDLSLFQRKIEFHLARKTFSGFSNGGGNFRLETLNPNSSNPQRHDPKPTMNGKKVDGSEENGVDPELNFGITFRRIGAGLENLGNTCFLNSVLQCLTYTEPLAAYLQSGKHQTSCRTAGFCALCAIQKHVSRALQSTGRILAPKEIVLNLRCISRNFRNSRQEDAHEYMVNLLESMHKCCLPSGVPSESPSAYDKSLVHKIFGGRLRSQVKCMQCSFCSNKFDPFLDLSLEIVKAESLYKALTHFTAKEQLDGGERHYQCQQCKQKVKALKQLTIHKAPYVLTIHLKRFGSHLAGQKIDKKILFGPTLDLKPFVTDPHDGDLKYTLYGVLVHAGWSTHSGHYYCFVRTSSGMWYSLDDNRVVQVSEKKVLDQKAYMLFYYRDKRNFVSKKPLDVAQKEIMPTNAMGRNKPYINFNQELKGTVESGRIEARVNDKMSAAAVAQRDSLNAGASLETLTNDVPNQTLSSFKKAECSAPNKDTPLEHSSRIPPVKDSVKGSSVTSRKDGECLPQQDSSVKGSNVPFKPDNAMITTSNAKLVECDPDRSSKKDAANIVAVPPSCNSILKSVTGKDLSDSGTISPNSNEFRNPKKDLDASIAISPNCCIPQRSPGVTSMTKKAPSGEIGDEASSLDASARKMEKVLPVMSSSPASRENSQGMTDAKSAELSSLPITKPISVQKDVLTKPISVQKNVLKGKPSQRLKKKLSKCPIIKMHLTSKIIFGTSLSVRKKKHKRSKKCTSGTTTLSQKHLLNGDNLPLDLEPSTSDRYKTMPFVGSAHSQRKGQKSGSKKKEKNFVENNVVTNSNGNFLVDVTDKEFRERTGQNGAVLAVVDRSQKSSSIVSSAGSQLDDIGLDNSRDSRRDSMQNGLMSMLTRGLEETIVARWDEIESYPSHMTEPSGVQNVTIGYVADEWDEEYDRGKRKKVRSFKNDFSGPNPFQEIANMNSKLKKARIDHSSSGNKPYRIG